MRCNQLIAPVFAAAAVGAAPMIGSLISGPPSEHPTAAQPETPPQMQLPPGWTEADMMACMVAGTPGEMHEFLADAAGTWRAETTMWMYAGAEPMTSEATSTVTPMMGGRYIKMEMTGEMPGGMGAFHGFGISGFDNVSQQFVSTWIDNMSTGMMTGVGELSPDGKTLTWEFTYNCPITKGPAVMREVETITGEDTKTLEMYMTDPKTGEEFRMMKIEFTRQKQDH